MIFATVYALAILVLAQIIPGMTPEMLSVLLSPIIVFGATALVKWAFPELAGKWIVSAIVPLLSAGAALISSIVVPEGSFWGALVVNLAATWIREVINQWMKQPATPAP